jgi:predicted component of type VI protein secretion system
MALLHPEAHERELELLARRESPFSYVSKRPHCAVVLSPAGAWTVATSRADVATLLNSARLYPDAPEPLRDGDRLTLGDYGPTLTITMIEG